MSDKKPGITMTAIVKPALEAPKVHKPGITTNMVNAPAPAPRAEGPIVRGPIISTHDEPPKVAPVTVEAPVPGVVEPIPAPSPKTKYRTADSLKVVIEPPDGKPLTGAARWTSDQFKMDLKEPKAPKSTPKAKRKPAARKKKA